MVFLQALTEEVANERIDLMPDPNLPIPEGAPLPVEETPEIPMPPPVASWTSKPVPPPKKKSSIWLTLILCILFVALFVVGMQFSSYLRNYFPNGLVGFTGQQQAVVNAPTPTPTPTDPFASWKTYQVISGVTKLPIDGISYKLPAEVLAPACDTTTCMSQGTYLPGGTRFTIAPRGEGQLLENFFGGAITDVGGSVFNSTLTTVNGHGATLFSGSFAGKTVGGYGFSQMRGYMIQISNALSLEVNHFVPDGVTADFPLDDTLFDQIVGTLVMPATPSAILTQSPTPATTSGN